jgi:phosphatidylserine decarboxylase
MRCQSRKDRGVEFMLAKGTPLYLALIPLTSLILFFVFLMEENWWLLGTCGFLFAAYLVLVSFFRDPERTISRGIVSPADGKVRCVERNGKECMISIFMNVTDVHVNRVPYRGRIVGQKHLPGGYIPAFKKESESNERLVTRIKTPLGTMTLKQIAGVVARRIIPYVAEGQDVGTGERIGLIRYGSRVDLLFVMPPGWEMKVSKGDRILAGETQIAYHKGNGE